MGGAGCAEQGEEGRRGAGTLGASRGFQGVTCLERGQRKSRIKQPAGGGRAEVEGSEGSKGGEAVFVVLVQKWAWLWLCP